MKIIVWSRSASSQPACGMHGDRIIIVPVRIAVHLSWFSHERRTFRAGLGQKMTVLSTSQPWGTQSQEPSFHSPASCPPHGEQTHRGHCAERETMLGVVRQPLTSLPRFTVHLGGANEPRYMPIHGARNTASRGSQQRSLQGVDFPFARHSLVFNDVSHRHTGAVCPIRPPSDVNCTGFGPPLCAGHVFLNLRLFKALEQNCLSFGQQPPLGTQFWH